MLSTTTTAENVIQHHLQALGNNNLKELLNDYTEQSELWTQNGIIAGMENISSFFSYAFTLLPKDKSSLEIKKMISKDEKVYIVWTADSPVINIPFATDCFEIKEGKITWQSTAFQTIEKLTNHNRHR
ncbi:nuclear transport factor 2 family protein [Ferruginibacter sp.]|uniref:nuclear transport factor 2 family protein n=1 Tax=Ferruginibacter sp. TaxID=1940288 RepID=UPI00265827A7|nr:nuclear transport factor 2 family protein [Ferruginibacter sp.]